MARDFIPEVEVDSCHHCPMRGPHRNNHRTCQLTGTEISYAAIPIGCPLKGGPVQITLSKRAKDSL